MDKLAQGSSVTALLKDGSRGILKGVLEVDPVEKTGQVGFSSAAASHADAGCCRFVVM